MTDHNEAMRLADELDKWARDYATTDFTDAMATKPAALLRQQAERIAELEDERDKLTQGIAQGLDGQTLLTDLALREGGLYAGIEGGAAGLLAAGFAEQFVEAGGVNYVEVSFTHPKTGPLIVTLQRAQGKTPHKLRVEAEAERDQLRAEVERLRVDGERYQVLRCYELGGAWPDGFKAPAGLLVFSGGLTQHELDKVLDDMLGHLPHPSPGSVRADYQQWRRSQTLSAVAAIDAARTTHKETE